MRDLDDAALEVRLREVLKEHLRALPLDLAVETLDRRRETKSVDRRFGRGHGITLLAAAALLLVGGAFAAGSGVLRRQAVVPPMPAPSLTAVVIASPDTPSPSPSESATASPTQTAAPIIWTEASLNQDWPDPVRSEPAGPPILVPIRQKVGHLADPTGDTGSDAVPWGDIDNVNLDPPLLQIHLVSGPDFDGASGGVDPRQVWYAYGVVVDTDGDGVADWRYGIDNVPVGTPAYYDGVTTRWWRTDLHTGRTDWMLADKLIGPAPDGFPPADPGSPREFIFGRTVGASAGLWLLFGKGLPTRFYAWASVIQDGRVVATDYAPDTGWLVPSPKGKSSPPAAVVATPTPAPTTVPMPTPAPTP